jgi:hypothetical protein
MFARILVGGALSPRPQVRIPYDNTKQADSNSA